jgi:hypothetical protein
MIKLKINMKNKDKNLQKAIEDLPKYEPKDDLWEKIEATLEQQNSKAGNAKTDTSIAPKKLFPFGFWKNSNKITPKMAIAASVASTILVSTWLYLGNKGNSEAETNAKLLATIQKISDVQPIFSNTDVAFQHLVVDGEKGAKFNLPNGTKILVPQDAFVDKNNKAIVGKVDLEYREFHEAAEILASGIPMVYDSAGIKQQFESAGMFEIRGFQDNKPVFIAKNKTIAVDMASFVTGDNFRFYYFDQTNTKDVAYHSPFFTAAYAQTAIQKDTANSVVQTQKTSQGYWKYLGMNASKINTDKLAKIDSVVQAFSKNYQSKIEAEKAIIAAESKKLEAENRQIQNHNVRLQETQNMFRLKFDTEKYPELAAFENISWEYTGEKVANKNPFAPKNDWIFERQWREIELTQSLFRPIALKGQPGEVTDVEFSSNGKFIATAAGGSAKIWDINGKLLHTLDEHAGVVKQVDFSKDSKFVLTVTNTFINLWNIEGKLLQTYGNNPTVIGKVFFADDDKKIVAYIGDHLKVWDLNGNTVADIVQGDKQEITDFAQIPTQNSKYSLKITKENKVEIYENNTLVKIISGHQNTIQNYYFSADGKMLVTISNDRTAKVWNVEDNFKLLSNLRIHKAGLDMACISPDGTSIVSVANDEKNKSVFKDDAVYLWKRRTPQDASIYEMNLYCKPETNAENMQFGNNMSFFTTIYRENNQNQLINSKANPMLAKRMADLDKLINDYQSAVALRKAAEEIRLANEANLLRAYQVSYFGIHNWDRPMEQENTFALQATFTLDSAIAKNITQYNNIRVFLITGQNNTIVQALNMHGKNSIRTLKNVSNQFVAVLPNNQVAIFSEKEFQNFMLGKDLNKDNTFTFQFTNIKPVNSVLDLKEYLKSNG